MREEITRALIQLIEESEDLRRGRYRLSSGLESMHYLDERRLTLSSLLRVDRESNLYDLALSF